MVDDPIPRIVEAVEEIQENNGEIKEDFEEP
jgi:hypothetical protein